MNSNHSTSQMTTFTSKADRDRVSTRVANLPASPIRRFFEIAATMDDVISLSIGEPDFVTPAPILEAGIQSLRDGQTAYTDTSGTIELREAIISKLSNLYGGPTYDPVSEALITIGVSEGTQLAFDAILNPGDEVLIPQPCFVSFTAAVQLAGGTPVPLATRVQDNFQILASDIEDAITPRTKALFLSYPNNPTGAVLEQARLEEIAQLAEVHDLIVISDEIYDQLVYGDHKHVMFAALPGMRDRTIHLGGFSKDYAMTGWRIGYALGPQDIVMAMRRVHQYQILSPPTTAQAAALCAMTNPAVEGHVAEMRASYDMRRRYIVSALNDMGLSCFDPKGAFYCFPDISPSGMNDYEFAERLLKEEHVAVIPGSAFGAGGDGHVRCCYAAKKEDIEESMKRLRTFMTRHG